MKWNDHSKLEGMHAFLGASKYHWLNYDSDKLVQVYKNIQLIEKGTKLHEFASTCIKMKQKLPRTKQTLNQFVNDAIGFRMDSEVMLYYSDNCFGTTDAIHFDKEKNILRIHDYKSGNTPAKMEQIYIYAALFCLEYGYKPTTLTYIFRIYQFDDYIEEEGDPEIVNNISKRIVEYSKIIDNIKGEENND